MAAAAALVRRFALCFAAAIGEWYARFDAVRRRRSLRVAAHASPRARTSTTAARLTITGTFANRVLNGNTAFGLRMHAVPIEAFGVVETFFERL